MEMEGIIKAEAGSHCHLILTIPWERITRKWRTHSLISLNPKMQLLKHAIEGFGREAILELFFRSSFYCMTN